MPRSKVDGWEAQGQFPSHDLFKRLGNLGLLGLTKPVKYGGQGLLGCMLVQATLIVDRFYIGSDDR